MDLNDTQIEKTSTNVEKEPIKKKNKSKIFIILIILVIVVIAGYKLIVDKMTKEKYSDAVNYFEQQEYDKASELFNHKYLYDYELSVDYRGAIYMIDLLNQEKYDEALQCDVSEEIQVVRSLKRFAQNGSYYKAQNYKAIWEDNKYTNTFYNDKEKEIVYDGIYNYGLSLYNEGYYGTTKEIFTKIKDYKNSAEILNDKYFKLIGNSYSYSISYGYTWGYVSMLFYSYGDNMLYNVFTQSLFNTNIPKGYDFAYRIKDNKLMIASSIVYDIVSFDGNTLVIKQNGSKFTLTKD